MTAADVVLEALRSRWPDAYRCHPEDLHRWLARCPGDGEPLVIVETGGVVMVLCAGGCTEGQVLDAFEVALGDNEHQAELAAQTLILDTDAERARRAGRAEREVRAWQ